MKKTIILISLTLFLLVGISAYSQQNENRTTSGNYQYPYNPDTTADNSAFINEIPRPDNFDNNPGNNANNHDNKIPYEAWWNVRINIMLLVVIAIQAIILFGQFIIMRKQLSLFSESVEATKIAANAAKDSSESLPRIERAYVFVEVKKDSLVSTYTTSNTINTAVEGPKELSVDLIVNNHGKTPAILTEFYYCYTIIQTEIPITPLIMSEQFFNPYVVIGSGGSRCVKKTMIPINTEKWSRIETGEAVMFCSGNTKYSDIFKNIQETKFSWKWNPLLKDFEDTGSEWNANT